MAGIAVLGATGSIGTQTLDVVRKCLPDCKVSVLTGNNNIAGLAKLANEFRPEILWVPDSARALETRKMLDYSCDILTGDDGLISAVVGSSGLVVNALVGRAGLAPTVAAIKAGRDVALANKETLVTAGGLIMGLARENGVRITPIDSEHSAIWQCLKGSDSSEVEKIILTASGGAFREWTKARIEKATARDALCHPNWAMGDKITIDSATLMNKGLEFIEAMWLFDMPLESIEILVHPQSIIHSMVQFKDGAIMAQMGLPDMRIPISYALSAFNKSKRIENDFPRLNFLDFKELTFDAVDLDRFPCLSLAYHAAKVGGTLPAVMNYVNEWAVHAFLDGKIKFYDISSLITQAFGAYTVKPVSCVQDIFDAEEWAFEFIKRQDR